MEELCFNPLPPSPISIPLSRSTQDVPDIEGELKITVLKTIAMPFGIISLDLFPGAIVKQIVEKNSPVGNGNSSLPRSEHPSTFRCSVFPLRHGFNAAAAKRVLIFICI